MKDYFNINGVDYTFKDRGAVFFNESGIGGVDGSGITMIYNNDTISNILKNVGFILRGCYENPDYLILSSKLKGNSEGGDGKNLTASCYFDIDLYGDVMLIHKNLYKRIVC